MTSAKPSPDERAAGTLADRMAAATQQADIEFVERRQFLLPFATAFVQMGHALWDVNEMAVAWQPLTPGDIAEVRAALSAYEALMSDTR